MQCRIPDSSSKSPSDLMLNFPSFFLFPESRTAQQSISARAASTLVARLVSGPGRPQEVAFRLLSELACDPVNHSNLLAAGILPPLIALLGSCSVEVQQAAAVALWWLARNAENKVIIKVRHSCFLSVSHAFYVILYAGRPRLI